MKNFAGSWEPENDRKYRDEKLKNVILIGFMGSGKSSVGYRLSYALKRSLCDTDSLIERREGRKISRIFEEEGEQYFRDLETATLKRMLEKKEYKRCILSLGGGTPLREENRKLLKQLGTVFYLRVTPEMVWERLKGDTTRPLLQTEDPRRTIRELLEKRDPIYMDAADIVVDCSGKEQDEIVEFIRKKTVEK